MMMNNKTKVWSNTETQSWSTVENLTPEQRANVETLMNGHIDDSVVNEEWSYTSTENGKSFKADIRNGRVTVNGREYDSLDDVPRADRERIDALRSDQHGGGLLDMLRKAGVDVANLPDGIAEHLASAASTGQRAPTSSHAARATQQVPSFDHATGTPDARGASDTLPPGAVPKSGSRWRWLLLILILAGLALYGMTR